MLPDRLARVVQLLARLPGVGEKTAQRFALHLVTGDETTSRELGRELTTLRDHVRPCARCGNIAQADAAGASATCSICADTRRDASLLCVVARVQDLLAVERSGAMRGRYFVLGRLLSPLDGIGADDLPLEALVARIRDEESPVREVLVATPPSVDGEATALLLARELGAFGVKVTRIASGVPHGGDLEFADQITIGRAIEGRKSFA
jgi:recombination protein RecR